MPYNELHVAQKGGYGKVSFTKKGPYNHIDKNRCAKVKDGDAVATLCYFQAKANNDPMLFREYTLTNNDK